MTAFSTISDAAALVRNGQLTPRQLVDQCLDAVQKYDDRLRAWVFVDAENARHTAELLGRELRSGNYRGPLHGIPLGIKDIIDVAGLPTRAGSSLRENYPAATVDAPLVTALRYAGAVILGKTVTVEFACFDPSPTRNPWDVNLQTTPGGSSSGSAVAVAMGMCFGALGTQTGGSLVRPAAYCGIAAIKPTFAMLTREGIVPVSYHLDHPGAMARTVSDLQILMQCLSGKASFKPGVISHPPQLGFLEKFFLDQVHPTVRQVIENSLTKLRQCGAYIVPVQTSLDFAEVAAMHRTIMAVEAAEYHRAQFAAHRDKYGPKISSLLDEGLKIPGVDYAAALAWQRDFRRRIAELFTHCNVLITPSTDTTAPATLETTGTPKFQAPWSCAGVPAVSLPCGLASDGMPVGMQLIGRESQDAALLTAAAWCERVIAFDKSPPLLCSSR
jgi:Asp-tRNA(Asn)/Glu-tRNA(Gln) amidotransferase A subunit family amidase